MKKILVAMLVVTALLFAITGCDFVNSLLGEKSYTVTFDTDGGTAVENQTVNFGGKATEPTAPTKEGFTFEGWFVDDVAYDFDAVVTDNITLKAKWTAKPAPAPATFTVTFDTDGAAAIDAQTVTEGETATKPADPTKEGYTFAGWFVGEAEYDFTAPVTADLTIKAAWTQITYTVTFDTNGADAIDAQTVVYGNAATKPADPTKTGYTFAGWYLGEDAYDFATILTGDITVKAEFTPNGYEVIFDTDGGDAIDTVVVTYGNTLAKPADPTKTGYTFAGWYLGEAEYDFETPVTDTITLKAAWNAIPYTVTFNTNGGSDVEAQTVNYGTAAEKPADPTKIAHNFLGWFVGDDEYDFATLITGDVTIEAKWELVKPDLPADMAGKYTGTETDGLYTNNFYTFDIDAENDTITASYENSYNTVEMVINYVLFENNVLTVNYTVGGNAYDMVFTYADGKLATESAAAGQALTLARTYTVTMDSNGAGTSKDKTFTVAHGDTLDEYKPTRTGYDLVGWFYDDGTPFDFNTPITSDITLTAEWEVKKFTVTFMGQDGVTPEATIQVEYNTPYGEITTPTTITTTDGFKFNGKWYTSLTGTSPVSATSKITADKTYYPGLIAPMNDIEGTWTGTDSKGNAFTMVVDAAEQTVAITTVNGETVTEYNVTTIYYKEFAGLSSTAVKLVVRYTIGDSTSEFTLTLTYAADGTFTGSNSLTLAKQGAETFTVTFDTDGGNTIDAETVMKDATVGKPADPTKDGFTFAGWYLGETEYDFTTPVTADITLVAKWTENVVVTEYTVTFNLNGGTLKNVELVQTVAGGATATDIGTPTRSNYTFLGWYNGDTAYNFETPVNGDITLTAMWKGVNKLIKIYKQDGTLYKEVNAEYGKTFAQALSIELTGVESDTVSDEVLAQLAAELTTITGSYYTGLWFTAANGSTLFDMTATVSANKNMHPCLVAPVAKELNDTWTCTYSNKVYDFTITVDTDDQGNVIGVSAKVAVDGAESNADFVRTCIKDGQLPQIIIKAGGKTYTIKQVLVEETYVWQYSSQTLTKVEA